MLPEQFMKDLLRPFFRRSNNLQMNTPSYVYFPKQIKENINLFKDFEKNGIKVFYAMKANNFKSVISDLVKSGFGFDVASKQELEYLLSFGVEGKNITFSATSKKEKDILYSGKKGVKYFAFDSEEEIQKIIKNVTSPQLFGRVAVHSKDAAFNLSNKFGMTEVFFTELLKKAKGNHWPIVGITFHVGSQNVSVNSWRDGLRYVDKLISIASSHGITIGYVNIGGGIPVPYKKNIKPTKYYVSKIIALCKAFSLERPDVKIFVEPGRALVANTMILLTKVIDLKPYKNPPIVVVDTGVFNGIIEPVEDFEYPIFTEYFGKRKSAIFKIAGFSCEGFDVINKNVKLPANIAVGDIIPIMYTGAYSFVYQRFHMVPYPEIVEVL